MQNRLRKRKKNSHFCSVSEEPGKDVAVVAVVVVAAVVVVVARN